MVELSHFGCLDFGISYSTRLVVLIKILGEIPQHDRGTGDKVEFYVARIAVAEHLVILSGLGGGLQAHLPVRGTVKPHGYALYGTHFLLAVGGLAHPGLCILGALQQVFVCFLFAHILQLGGTYQSVERVDQMAVMVPVGLYFVLVHTRLGEDFLIEFLLFGHQGFTFLHISEHGAVNDLHHHGVGVEKHHSVVHQQPDGVLPRIGHSVLSPQL